ncbi:C2 calcium-dependent domain-containing protein 4C-like [Rhinophrynus dorsalis]
MVGKDRSIHLHPTCQNVLTPDRIPEFCIPPRHQAQKLLRARFHQESFPDLCSSAFEAGLARLSEVHIIQVDSVEESPEEESTNSDPRSQAALSLPHLLKAQTSYGFCTLLESPNTRRKESLFHNDLADFPFLLSRSRSNTISYRGTFSPSSFTTLQLRPLSRSGTLDSDTASSTDSSPFSSPLLHRSLPSAFLKALSQDKMFPKALRVSCKTSALRNNSVSTDEDSSADSSPCVTRRTSDEWAQPPSYSNTDHVLSLDQLPLDITVTLDTGGILRLTTEYCIENRRLRIRLVSAEGLYKPSTDPKNISCCVSLSLAPGKKQKQRSALIRGSRNPIFNEDFYFEGVESCGLLQKTLKFKALNKGSCVRRESILGRSKIPLLSVLPT